MLESPLLYSGEGFELSVNLVALFESCSKTVKSIKLHHVIRDLDDIKFEDSYRAERLTILSSLIPINFSTLISECLPNSHHLSIDGYLHLDMDMLLPNHHFPYIQLPFYSNKQYIIYVKTIKNSSQKLFRPEDKTTRVNISRYERFVKPIFEGIFSDEPSVKADWIQFLISLKLTTRQD